MCGVRIGMLGISTCSVNSMREGFRRIFRNIDSRESLVVPIRSRFRILPRVSPPSCGAMLGTEWATGFRPQERLACTRRFEEQRNYGKSHRKNRLRGPVVCRASGFEDHVQARVALYAYTCCCVCTIRVRVCACTCAPAQVAISRL